MNFNSEIDLAKAPFRCENFWFLTTVALSFVFGKNCPIMDYLDLKDSSRQLRTNCAINYSFYLHLMLHAYAARFDVTKNLKNFWILGSKQALTLHSYADKVHASHLMILPHQTRVPYSMY